MIFDKNIKVIDLRLIASKTLLVQILKLISHVQYALNKSKNENEITLTIKVKNKYKLELLASIDDKLITEIPTIDEFTIGA